MCGIVGLISWNKSLDVEAVKRMNDSLIHRGPDAGRIFSNEIIALGHRRLSVLDLSDLANQPMISSSGDCIIIFNGEIYNYQNLRSELEKNGSIFITNGDTEVILEAYRVWGEGCVCRLEGMFAFAIWNFITSSLFLARDRLGEKPLYYGDLGSNGFIFASELRAIRASRLVKEEVDLNALGQYLKQNYVSGAHSMIKGISKLLPGTYLIYKKDAAIQITEYWKLSDFFNAKKSTDSVEDAAEKLNFLIGQSIKKMMVSDVPLGGFLSGGIDSSSVTGGMVNAHHNTNSKINTFCIGFDERGYSETAEARRVAEFFQTTHYEQIISSDISDDFVKIIKAMDEPVADTSFIPFYNLAKFAKKNVTVALSGDGADELFAGYETYSADKIKSLLKWMPSSSWEILDAFVKKAMPVSFNKVSVDYKLRKFIGGQKLNSDMAHMYWRTIFDDEGMRNLLLPEVYQAILKENPLDYHFKKYSEVADAHYLDRGMYLDLKTWLPDDILAKVDRATMAHSLESRAPFLDSKIVEFAATLPVNFKMNGFNKKFLLKKSQQNTLPGYVLNQKKKGFNAPVAHWMSGTLRNTMYFATTYEGLKEFFNFEEIHKLWRDHDLKVSDNSYKLFGIACFSIWLQNS